MGTNTVGLAFGGASADIRKANRVSCCFEDVSVMCGLLERYLKNVRYCFVQGRTYYISCLSRLEADEWCNAIANNVRALPVEKSKFQIGKSHAACTFAMILTYLNRLLLFFQWGRLAAQTATLA